MWSDNPQDTRDGTAQQLITRDIEGQGHRCSLTTPEPSEPIRATLYDTELGHTDPTTRNDRLRELTELEEQV